MKSAVKPNVPISEPSPQELRVVLLGDSLAAGTGDETGGGIAGRLPKYLSAPAFELGDLTNLGVKGAQTTDVLERIRKDRARTVIGKSNVVILSIGANDLFRTQAAREQTMRSPFRAAEAILEKIAGVISEIERINPSTRILILGAYNPVPRQPFGPMLDSYLPVWDETLSARFNDRSHIQVVMMSDLVTPKRLSRLDSFHPGGEAYEEAAKRIASMLGNN